MLTPQDREFGDLITRLIRKQNLNRETARTAFKLILSDTVTAMQQGAFLAALAAKGETEDEVAGGWEAIYELDTTKVKLNGGGPVVDNSGTGMDTFKTFNISTAASLIAAAAGVRMARHGARAITSVCGTVDMAEALGVDVECDAQTVADSIETVGIGLFNGMSAQIHPMALGRILANISFGSTLNIAASLANPARPRVGVRGVWAKTMIEPVVRVMQAIGYQRALVIHGAIDGSELGMDEASVCGTTHGAELTADGEIKPFCLRPEALRLDLQDAGRLTPAPDIGDEARRFVALLSGRTNGARRHAAILNAGLIFYAAGQTTTIEHGVRQADEVLQSGAALTMLGDWVQSQNRTPDQGLARLQQHM